MTVVADAAAPPATPPPLAFKTGAILTAAPGTVAVRGDEGVVTAVVSVTGIVDEVQDVILPGAYKSTLARRRPKVVWHHQWESPIGRVLHVEELPPGDPRLPAQTKDGAAWPSRAGAVVATMQFNLSSDRGREAFEAVKFFSESGECEWSIGYRVGPGQATKDRAGVRRIRELELYEISYVLWGAASQTGTLDLKAATALMLERKATAADGREDPQPDGAEPDDVGVEPVPGDVAPDPTPDPSDPAEAKGAGEPGDPVEHGVAVDEAALHAAAMAEIDWDEVAAAAAVRDRIDAGATHDTPEGDIDVAPATTGQSVVKGLVRLDADVLTAALSELDDEVKAALAVGLDPATLEPLPAPDGMEPAPVPDGTVPEAPPPPRPPPGEPETKAEGGADRNRGNAEQLRRWYLHEAGIPWGAPGDFMACVAIAQKHMTPGNARGYCQLRHIDATGDPAGRGAHDGKALLDAWDPTAETGDLAAHLPPPEGKAIETGYLPDTLEERRDAVRLAVGEALRGDPGEDGRYEWDTVTLLGTWDDRAVASRDRVAAGRETTETFEVPYEVADDGAVLLGQPQPVELQATVLPTFDATVWQVEEVAAAVKALLHASPAGNETKAGRVLSSVNLGALQQAATQLIAVLRRAGVEIVEPTAKQVEDVDGQGEPVVAPDTTSDGARAESKALVTLTADEVRDAMALLAD